MLKTLLILIFLSWAPLGIAASSAKASAYEDLKQLIRLNPQTRKPVRSIVELVSLLPDELLSNFTFIYESRSPHGGLGQSEKSAVSPLFPRTVLFTEDAKLVLAFTGNPDGEGYNTLEVIRFNERKDSFLLSKFVLPDAKEKYAQNGKDNPAECLRCHGKDPRPIFDSYPLWPGFYGSVQDTFPPKSEELNFYKTFLKNQKESKTSVYGKLHWPTGSPVSPYLDPEKFDLTQIVASPSNLAFQPNTRLGMALTELNRRRLLRKLKASPLYERYKYQLLSGLLGCTELPISKERGQDIASVVKEENRKRIERLKSKIEGLGTGKLNMMELGFLDTLAEIDYVGNLLRVSRLDWSMAFETNSFSYFDGILSGVSGGKSYYLKEDFIFEILNDVATKDSAFRPFFNPYSAYPDSRSRFGIRLGLPAALGACKTLAVRSKAKPKLPEMKYVPSKAPADRTAQTQELEVPFKTCTSCHEGNSTIALTRSIPFSAPAQLAQRLREPSAKGDRTLYQEILERVSAPGFGQMPPFGKRLSSAEVQELKQSLDLVLDAE